LKNPNFFVSNTRVTFKNLPKTFENLEEILRNYIRKTLNKEKVIQKVYISRDKAFNDPE